MCYYRFILFLEGIMSISYNFKRILSLVLTLIFVFSGFVFHTSSAESTSVIYISPDGNDSYNGTKNAPVKTLDCAFSKLNGGGYVVVMGDISSNITILNAAVTQKCKNTKPIIITGKDPQSGEIFSDASIAVNSPRLYGEMHFEHIKLCPTRNYAFFNTYGNTLKFLDGTTHEGFNLYIHGGSFGNTVSESSFIQVDSGSFTVAYLGGAFVTNGLGGISGDSKFVINGGFVNNLYIGFDSSAENHVEGKIDGNVVIRHNGGIINTVSSRLLKDDTVGGYIAIISKGGLSADMTKLPKAKKGIYQITYTGKGEIFETDTPGVFTLLPEKGYTTYINGKKVPDSTATISQGATVVKFVKDTVPTYFEGILFDTDTVNFNPDSFATRKELATAAIRCLENKAVTYDYETLCTLLSEYGALPYGWENGTENDKVTKDELVFIFYSLFDAHADSTKLFDFSDVDENHPYYEEISGAAGKGKIFGYAGSNFSPNDQLTRYDMCEMLAFYLDRVAEEGAKSKFIDIDSDKACAVVACTTDRVEGLWDFQERKYVLPDSNKTEDYIKALHSQSAYLSPDEIKNASDVIAKKVRDNILATPNTKDIYDFDSLGIKKVYYVSERFGNDKNDGLSVNTPFKTPAALVGKIQRNSNVAVLFERGGVYRTGTSNPLNLSGSKNIVLGSYGIGNKPLIIQSRWNYANDNWTQVQPNIYRLETPLRNVGVMAFDHDMQDYSDDTFDELFGEIENIGTQGFNGINDLDTDLQFYCELQPTYNEEITEEIVGGQKITTKVVTESYDRFTTGYLYLYSDKGNPSERFSSIEIGENYDLVDGGAHGAIIDNISFKYTGAHGIGLSVGENLTVTNCIFSWLGGSILWETEEVTTTVTNQATGETKTTRTYEEATCYGNAVEVYGPCDGYYVKNNWIYQIFDDGITNQYHNQIDCIQKDIVYSGNLLEYVYHMFSNSKSNDKYHDSTDFETEGPNAVSSYTKDLEMSYNICRMAGYGWGGPMKNRVHTGMMYRTYVADYNKDEYVFYNLFDTNGGYTVFSASNAHDSYDSNIYIQEIGTKLRSKLHTGITTFSENAHRDIANLLGDKNAVTVLSEAGSVVDCRKKTDTLTFLGAQIRADRTHALRFLFTISRDSYEKMLPDNLPTSAKDTEAGFGAVIIPQDFLEDEQLYKNTLTVKNGVAVRAAVVPAVRLYAENDDEIIFSLCLTDILPSNYSRKYVSIPYMTYEDEGALKTVYGEQAGGISMYDIAQLAYIDHRNSEEIRNSIYDKILSVVDPEKYPARN